MRLFAQQRPETIEIDRWTPTTILQFVKFTLTNFAEVTRMVLVEQGSVVMETTSITTATGVFTVFANTTVAMRDIA